jgi:hypothetical protein
MNGPELVEKVRSGFNYQNLTKLEQKAYWAEITRPKFYGMVGKWRMNNCSFRYTQEGGRSDIEEGAFGAVAPLICEYCGPVWGELESVCTHRGCGFENYWGPEPDEYEDFCPSCGRSECCGENEDPQLAFKVVNRYTQPIRLRAKVNQ